MEQTYKPQNAVRWLTTLFGILVLAFGCVGSLLLLYGGGSWETAAQIEATSLASVELSELVGTSDYQQINNHTQKTLLSAFSETLRLPLVNPQGMLETQLPLTSISLSHDAGTQSSLFHSLRTWEQQTNKIALGWIPYDTPSRSIHMIQQNPGITVISPQWLTVKNQSGDLTNQTQTQVVDYAHQHNIKVWAMLDNQFQSQLTHAVLSDTKRMQSLVHKVTDAVKSGHLDGVNVDFENIKSADEQGFTQFVHELHDALHPLNIRLSVDITPDIVFLQDDAAYFHAGLAQYADYVIVMAYDEHWGGDQTPGPVADVPWVVSAVDDLLSTGVPADQLILGLPFYARFWYVHTDGSVTSQAIAAPNIDAVLNSHHASSSWDDGLGVAFAQYKKEDGHVEVWYETDKTMNRKLNLVNDRGLAGVAIWSLSLSNEQTWSKMIQALRQSVS